jgi:hypothetical protein
MAQDVYGIETQIGGAWQLEGAVLHIEDASELVVTSADITYQRASTKFSPLNQNKKYIATGEANGVISLGMVVGPSRDIKDFLARYADACRVTENVLTLQPAGFKECENDSFTGIEFVCNGVLLNNLRISVTQIGANLTVVSAGLGMSFVSLQIK